MAIGAIFGIAASIYQMVQATNRPESPAQAASQSASMSDRLFAQIDTAGDGAIDGSDLRNAFDRIAGDAANKSEQLFSRLDADGDGKITKEEFSGSINRLAEQLNDHFMRQRMFGASAPPPPQANDPGFTRDELNNLVSGITANFDQADADGDGRVSIREALAFHRSQQTESGTAVAAGNQNVDMMLQVMRLMNAYGITREANNASTKKGSTLSVSA